MWKVNVRQLEQINLIAIIIWVLGIIYACLTPNDQMPNVHFFEGFDKVMHFLFHATLIFLLLTYKLLKNAANWWAALSIVIELAFGLSIEYIQRALDTGRSFSVEDILANCLGLLVGIIIYLFFESVLVSCLKRVNGVVPH